ncbi:cytidine deaminase-like protein [Peziza echinospora]|nr:cytidine deaminase-like protein [Peziza echinospora]
MENGKTEDAGAVLGKVMPLATFMEHKASVETVEVYVCPVPSKKANFILNALREALPKSKGGNDLQHLRKLVREEFLSRNVVLAAPKKFQKPSMLYILICPTSNIDLTTLYAKLSPLLFPASPEISCVDVPFHACISQDQADEWSIQYWPTIYKRGNPFGPHPPYVEQTINKTLPNVAKYISLAREAAKQSFDAGFGIQTGAVVVDPSNEEVAAVAGDGRHMTFGGDERNKGCTWGNPLEHAVMRVVGMVASKRKLREELEIGTKVDIEEGVEMMKARENDLRHIPNTDVEKKYFYSINLKKLSSTSIVNTAENEYLCHNHIVYLTHEPCVMCSMALIHSRIGMVRKARRGFSSSESDNELGAGAGYGLFWRKELNWKFLAFEWVEPGENLGGEIEGHDYYV